MEPNTDQNVCEFCFSVVWWLCWSYCSCLCTLFWFTNVGYVSSLCFLLFPAFLGFVMPVGILFPAPANRLDTVYRDSTTELRLPAPDPKVLVTGITHPLCRPTDAAERKSRVLVTQMSNGAVRTGFQMGQIFYSSLCGPERAGTGWDLLFWWQQRGYIYVT